MIDLRYSKGKAILEGENFKLSRPMPESRFKQYKIRYENRGIFGREAIRLLLGKCARNGRNN